MPRPAFGPYFRTVGIKRAMHGKLLMENDALDEKQDDLTALHKVVNLINKLVLNECGYEGKYFDYTSWQYQDFSPVDLGEIAS